MIQEETGSIGKGKIGSHDFMIFHYKVSLCPKQGQKHEWEQCVYAHRGERARRRHPSKYQAVQCPEARAKKLCPRADDCNCTHNLWEYWLHPDRYMTCLCELGSACNRPICFFAHEQHELRPLPAGLSHPDEDMFPRPPRKERLQRNDTGSSKGSSNSSSSRVGSSSSTHSSTHHLQLQSASDPGVPSQQHQYGGGLPSGAAGNSSSRPGSSLGATAGPMQLPAAVGAAGQGLAGAFTALELLSLPDNQCAAATAGAVSSPLQLQLPLQQQQSGSDMASSGSAAAAAGLQVLAAPALPSPTGLAQQQQHLGASNAASLVSSQACGLLSSSPLSNLSPGRISPMSAGSSGVDSMMEPVMQPAYSAAMVTSSLDMQQQVLRMQQMQGLQMQLQQQQLQLQQQQQQRSGHLPVVMYDALSQAQLQQTGLACMPQQMMPVQYVDDGQPENLSFSMWGPEAVGQPVYMQQQQVVMPQQLAHQQQQMVQLGQWQQQEAAMQQPVMMLASARNMPAAVGNLSPTAAAAMHQGPGGGVGSAAGFQAWNALQQQQAALQQQQQAALQQQVQQQALLQQQLSMQQQSAEFAGSPPHPFWG